jgi:hypothetical protein
VSLMHIAHVHCVDGDGTTDILMPVCWPTPNCTEDNYILMSYNVQVMS